MRGGVARMSGCMNRLNKHLRNTFLAGVFAATPLAVTIFVIWYVEHLTREPVSALLGINIPFIGVVLALVLIYLLGLAVTSIVGKVCLRAIDRVLLRVPILKELYTAWKHVSLTPGGREGIFSNVVLVPDEGGDMWTIGFSSGEAIAGDSDTCCVFLPASPNPMNGRLYFVRRHNVVRLNMPSEEAFKIIISGGNYVPPELGAATAGLPRPATPSTRA